MKVIIAGGRNITDTAALGRALRRAAEDGVTFDEVVCGGAAGVDEMGRRWAVSNGIPVRLFPADWGKHGRAAGPIRNEEMARYADALILIWDGNSPGSSSMLRQARAHGLNITQELV